MRKHGTRAEVLAGKALQTRAGHTAEILRGRAAAPTAAAAASTAAAGGTPAPAASRSRARAPASAPRGTQLINLADYNRKKKERAEYEREHRDPSSAREARYRAQGIDAKLAKSLAELNLGDSDPLVAALLAGATRAPVAPVVNVPAPVVNVPAPVVNVRPPTLHIPTPVVHVHAPPQQAPQQAPQQRQQHGVPLNLLARLPQIDKNGVLSQRDVGSKSLADLKTQATATYRKGKELEAAGDPRAPKYLAAADAIRQRAIEFHAVELALGSARLKTLADAENQAARANLVALDPAAVQQAEGAVVPDFAVARQSIDNAIAVAAAAAASAPGGGAQAAANTANATSAPGVPPAANTAQLGAPPPAAPQPGAPPVSAPTASGAAALTATQTGLNPGAVVALAQQATNPADAAAAQQAALAQQAADAAAALLLSQRQTSTVQADAAQLAAAAAAAQQQQADAAAAAASQAAMNAALSRPSSPQVFTTPPTSRSASPVNRPVSPTPRPASPSQSTLLNVLGGAPAPTPDQNLATDLTGAAAPPAPASSASVASGIGSSAAAAAGTAAAPQRTKAQRKKDRQRARAAAQAVYGP